MYLQEKFLNRQDAKSAKKVLREIQGYSVNDGIRYRPE